MFRLEAVSLMTTKGRVRQSSHIEHRDDVDWVKHCMTVEADGTREMEHPRRNNGWDDVKI